MMNDKKSSEIVSLRIPSGWCMVFNSFFEVDPILESDIFVNAHYFSEDMLLIERKINPGAKWMPLLIDVGWYPEEDVNGRFIITLASGNMEYELYSLETKDRLEVCKTVEKWMVLLATTVTEQEVRNILGLTSE